MLGYNDGEVLELFKYALPIRYYYLLFDIQYLQEAFDSAKCLMTKEQWNKQLADKNIIPFMVVNTHYPRKAEIGVI